MVKAEVNSTSLIVDDHRSQNDFENEASADSIEEDAPIAKQLSDTRILATISKNGSKATLPSPFGSAKSFDLQVANWRMGKLEVDGNSASEEEFYDCLGT